MRWPWIRQPIRVAGARRSLREQRAVAEPDWRMWSREGKPHPAGLEGYLDYYREHDVVHAAVNSLAEMIVGVGYYTESGDEAAKRAVDAFAERVNLDEILLRIARNMLIYGFAPVERVEKEGRIVSFTPLPPETVYYISDEFGAVQGYVQKVGTRRVNFKPEEIVWLVYNQVGGDLYGTSTIRPIADLLDKKRIILDDMEEIFGRYAKPLVIYKTKNPADADLLKSQIDLLGRDEDLIIGGGAGGGVEHEVVGLDPRSRFWEYVEYIDGLIFEVLQAPLLTYLRNATEASARVMFDAIDRHVDGVQRYLKRKVEAELFSPVVKAEVGSDVEVPALRWGGPRTGLENLSVGEFLSKGLEVGYISAEQYAALLMQMGLKLEAEEAAPRPPGRAEAHRSS